MLESLFNKVAGHQAGIGLPATLLKESPIQVFSCEYCEIFKNTYFAKHLQTAAYGTPEDIRLSGYLFASCLLLWSYLKKG